MIPGRIETQPQTRSVAPAVYTAENPVPFECPYKNNGACSSSGCLHFSPIALSRSSKRLLGQNPRCTGFPMNLNNARWSSRAIWRSSGFTKSGVPLPCPEMATTPLTTSTPSGTHPSKVASSRFPSPFSATRLRHWASSSFQLQFRTTACSEAGVPHLASSSLPSQRPASFWGTVWERTQPILWHSGRDNVSENVRSAAEAPTAKQSARPGATSARIKDLRFSGRTFRTGVEAVCFIPFDYPHRATSFAPRTRSLEHAPERAVFASGYAPLRTFPSSLRSC